MCWHPNSNILKPRSSVGLNLGKWGSKSSMASSTRNCHLSLVQGIWAKTRRDLIAAGSFWETTLLSGIGGLNVTLCLPRPLPNHSRTVPCDTDGDMVRIALSCEGAVWVLVILSRPAKWEHFWDVLTKYQGYGCVCVSVFLYMCTCACANWQFSGGLLQCFSSSHQRVWKQNTHCGNNHNLKKSNTLWELCTYTSHFLKKSSMTPKVDELLIEEPGELELQWLVVAHLTWQDHALPHGDVQRRWQSGYYGWLWNKQLHPWMLAHACVGSPSSLNGSAKIQSSWWKSICVHDSCSGCLFKCPASSESQCRAGNQSKEQALPSSLWKCQTQLIEGCIGWSLQKNSLCSNSNRHLFEPALSSTEDSARIISLSCEASLCHDKLCVWHRISPNQPQITTKTVNWGKLVFKASQHHRGRGKCPHLLISCDRRIRAEGHGKGGDCVSSPFMAPVFLLGVLWLLG